MTNQEQLLWLYSNKVSWSAASRKPKERRMQQQYVEHIASRLDITTAAGLTAPNAYMAGADVSATKEGAKELASRWLQELIDSGVLKIGLGALLRFIGFSGVPGWITSMLFQLALKWLMNRDAA